MSHSIERNYFTHREGTTAPWHGIVHRTHDGTWPDFLSASKMGEEGDFNSKKTYFLRSWKKFCEEIGNLATRASYDALEDFAKRQLAEVEHMQTLVRKFDGKAFVVPRTYKVHQPREVLEVAKRLYEEGGIELDTAMWLDDGQRICFSGKINGDFVVNGLPGKDSLAHHGRLNGTTGFVPGIATQYFTSVTCIVCMNTLKIAMSENGAKRRFTHATMLSGEKVRSATELVRRAKAAVEDYCEVAGRLRQVTISEETVYEYLGKMGFLSSKELLEEITDAAEDTSDLFSQVLNRTEKVNGRENEKRKLTHVGKAVLESIIESPGNDDSETLFALLQGTTHAMDHEVLRRKGKDDGENEDSILTSRMFGPRAKLKEQALQTVVEMMEARA